MRNILLAALACCTLLIVSCDKDVPGCTDPNAVNFNPEATITDGNCVYRGCTDPMADNFDPQATEDSGNCIFNGCLDEKSDQYDANANTDDGSCATYFDRWVGTFSGDFECAGLLSTFFGAADMTFQKLDDPTNTDSIEVVIGLDLTNLPL